MMPTETSTAPVVGEFATYGIGSDRYPVEIIAVAPRKITTRSAATIYSGGPDRGTAAWGGDKPGTFTVGPNEHGTIREFTLRGDGAWRPKGASYGYLQLGAVDDYRDPSF